MLKIRYLTISRNAVGGKFDFAFDFVRFAEQKTIGKALERMMLNGKLLRICRGTFFYPKIDEVLGLGVLFPT